MNKPFTPPPGMTGPQPPHAWDPYGAHTGLLPERSLAELARDATPEFIEIWRGLMLRKWMILGVTALATTITVFALMQMTPVYRSTATVLIEQNPGKVVGIDQVYGGIASCCPDSARRGFPQILGAAGLALLTQRLVAGIAVDSIFAIDNMICVNAFILILLGTSVSLQSRWQRDRVPGFVRGVR